VEELGRLSGQSGLWNAYHQMAHIKGYSYRFGLIFITFLFFAAIASHPNAPEQAVIIYSTASIQPQQPVDEAEMIRITAGTGRMEGRGWDGQTSV
jgi:hypothetical protein